MMENLNEMRQNKNNDGEELKVEDGKCEMRQI